MALNKNGVVVLRFSSIAFSPKKLNCEIGYIAIGQNAFISTQASSLCQGVPINIIGFPGSTMFVASSLTISFVCSLSAFEILSLSVIISSHKILSKWYPVSELSIPNAVRLTSGVIVLLKLYLNFPSFAIVALG